MFGRRKNRTIGEITYAIDHDTGLLLGGANFKTVVMMDGKLFEAVRVGFDTKFLSARYSVAGVEESFKLALLNDYSYDFEYIVRVPGATRQVIKGNFSELRNAEFKANDGRGQGSLSKWVTSNGGNPDILVACVTAFKAYIRNHSGGKLEPKVKVAKIKEPKKPGRVPSAVPTRTQGDNLKSYQLERRECVKELRDVMCSAKESLGVSVSSRGVPTISTVAVQEYLTEGLKEMSGSRDRGRVAKRIIRKYHFETPIQAKAFYPAAVDAVKAATEAINDYMKS